MAGGLPPPPTRSDSGDFVWIDWYNKLNNFLNSGGIVAWTSIDFTGSNLGDIVTRNHEQLNGIQGGTTGEHYHLTAAEHAAFVTPQTFISQAADPTTVQLPSTRWNMYKNTTTGLVKIWANDGGTLKSILLT